MALPRPILSPRENRLQNLLAQKAAGLIIIEVVYMPIQVLRGSA
jgi:hypothetical protein